MPEKDVRNVCASCFNSSNYGGNPRLIDVKQTTLSSSGGSGGGGAQTRRMCKVCGEEWQAQRVVLGAWNKWKLVQSRPDGVVYHVCSRAEECPDEQCKKAHSKDELDVWKHDRDAECGVLPDRPRPFPEALLSTAPSIMDVKALACSGYHDYGRCPDVHGCVYAHTDAELWAWRAELQRRKDAFRPPPQFVPPMSGGGGNRGSYARGGGVRVRPKPAMPWVHYFRMCRSIANRVHCHNGEHCSYAHSLEEQRAWNDPINSVQVVRPPGPGGQYHPFIEEVRTVLRSMSPKELMQDKHNVTIVEESNTPNVQKVTELTKLTWRFAVRATARHTLKSIILVDKSVKSIQIMSAAQYNSGKLGNKFNPVTTNDGVKIGAKVSSSSQIFVKVVYNPVKSLVRQVLVFQFDRFMIGRPLYVEYLPPESMEAESGMQSRLNQRPAVDKAKAAQVNSRSLFWEEQFEIISYPQEFPRNPALPIYPLPIEIESQLKIGSYDHLETELTEVNYRSCLHILLYIEEVEMRNKFQRFDVYDAELIFMDKVAINEHENVPPGYSKTDHDEFRVCKVGLQAELEDHELSLSTFSTALLRPVGEKLSPTAYEATIAHIGRDFVVLKVPKRVAEICAPSKVDIRFRIYRDDMRSWHYAIDHLTLPVVFPKVPCDPAEMKTQAPAILNMKGLEEELKHTILNESQRAVLESVLHLEHRHVPTILSGPFGTGKTRSLLEAVLLLLRYLPTSKILVCCHVNQTADHYVRDLHQKWTEYGGKKLSMLRFYTRDRRVLGVEEDVRQYCKTNPGGNQFEYPSKSELLSYQCIVTSVSGAGELMFHDLPKNHFTHIFIDEATQMTEPCTVVPLTLASVGCKVVLAGDIMQVEPVVQSSLARRYNLHRSLLERMYLIEAYQRVPLLHIELWLNYRSVREILELASDLFYNGKVQPRHKRKPGGPQDRAAISFRHVNGSETQDVASPSFINVQEVEAIREEVRKFCDAGLSQKEIAVVAPYFRQVQRIRYFLRQDGFRDVTVLTMRGLQGHEYRVLIVSTVRTCGTEKDRISDAPTLGFLSGPKVFTTLITRAEEWLVVVGHAITLVTVGNNRSNWHQYMMRCKRMGSFFGEPGEEADPETIWEQSGGLRDLVVNATDPAYQEGEQVKASTLPQNQKTIGLFRDAPIETRRKIFWPRLEPTVRELFPQRYHQLLGKLTEEPIEEIFDMLCNTTYMKKRVEVIAESLGMVMHVPDDRTTALVPSHLVREPIMLPPPAVDEQDAEGYDQPETDQAQYKLSAATPAFRPQNYGRVANGNGGVPGGDGYYQNRSASGGLYMAGPEHGAAAANLPIHEMLNECLLQESELLVQMEHQVALFGEEVQQAMEGSQLTPQQVQAVMRTESNLSQQTMLVKQRRDQTNQQLMLLEEFAVLLQSTSSILAAVPSSQPANSSSRSNESHSEAPAAAQSAGASPPATAAAAPVQQRQPPPPTRRAYQQPPASASSTHTQQSSNAKPPASAAEPKPSQVGLSDSNGAQGQQPAAGNQPPKGYAWGNPRPTGPDSHPQPSPPVRRAGGGPGPGMGLAPRTGPGPYPVVPAHLAPNRSGQVHPYRGLPRPMHPQPMGRLPHLGNPGIRPGLVGYARAPMAAQQLPLRPSGPYHPAMAPFMPAQGPGSYPGHHANHR